VAELVEDHTAENGGQQAHRINGDADTSFAQVFEKHVRRQQQERPVDENADVERWRFI
jgi:hypothetical protein